MRRHEMTRASDFAGTWRLEWFRATSPNGDTIYPYGESALGRITYDDRGHMSVQIMSRDRQPFSTDDVRGAPPEEIVQAFRTYIAYYGTYSVDLEACEVTHHLEVASVPNWVGSDQVRRFEFAEDTLQLSTPPIMIDGVAAQSVLLWRRA
jgi:Lipocalin-like domain